MPASRNEKHQGRFGLYSRLKPFIYLFYILVFVNGAVEITLRKFDPTGLDAYFTGVRRYFSNMVTNPDYAYIHKTHYTDHLSGADITINKHGLRSPEIDMKKKDGTKRVMIMGDSVVFGWGVEQDSIFPIRLQKMLDKSGPEYEVIAAGVGSWNTRTEYEYFRSAGIEFDPDVLVLVIVANDIDPKPDGRTDISHDRLFAYTKRTGTPAHGLGDFARDLKTSRSKLLQHIRYILTRRKVNKTTKQFDDHSPQWEDAQIALEKLIGLCKENDIAFVACIYGYDDMVGSPPLSYYDRRLKQLAVPVVTLPKAIFTDRQYHNSIVDRHPNAAGHKLIADELFAAIAPTTD